MLHNGKCKGRRRNSPHAADGNIGPADYIIWMNKLIHIQLQPDLRSEYYPGE